MKTLIDFPELTEDEISHSEQLIEKIIQRMGGKVVPFSDYMQMALYEPGLGYYTAGLTKIGAQGDFVTAPEISHLFGQCLAFALQQKFKNGRARHILEFGAGTGKLCLDIVNSLKEQSVAWQSYQILETSADLIQRQKEQLQKGLSANEFNKIEWVAQLPEQFEGVVIGNEVMDAMPVNVVIKKEEQWHELGVVFENKRFRWQQIQGESEAVQLMKVIEKENQLQLKTGYCTEINLQHKAWMNSLAEACKSVDVLLIDYGYFQAEYYHEDRTTGTLMCYFRHRAHSDPLVLPGLQDITASVDFSALAQAAENGGFEVQEICTQAEFLMSHNLLQFASERTLDKTVKNIQIYELKTAQEIKTLTLPAEMGETFKVMSFSK